MSKAVNSTLFLVLFLFSGLLFSQRQITTFGIQIKPIVSSEIINTGAQTNQEGEIGFTIEPDQGYGFGMVVRRGYTKQFSIETGINYTRRDYKLSISNDATGFIGNSDFSYVIYEIPILGLIYAQMGEQAFLNAAFGTTLNFLPSNWESFDSYFLHFSERRSWILPALVANLGFEYRTYESGYFYVGFSYHRPFSNITTAGVLYQEDRIELERTFFDISGNYLTIDFRYFFHEPPDYRR